MIYNKLYYSSVKFDGVGSSFGPNFICPKCGTRFKDNKSVIAITSVVKDSRRRTFTCPKCEAKIELYVAVARTDKGQQGLQISVNPIDPDWLEKSIADREEITP